MGEDVARIQCEARLADLEARVAQLEMQLAATELRAGAAAAARDDMRSGIPGARQGQPHSPLALDGWDSRFSADQFGQAYYMIELTLRNTTDKRIKLIDATVSFADLLGAQMYGIKVDPDIAIDAGQAQRHAANYSVNQFMPEQLRMRDMNKSDIVARLEVRRVVFQDNTVLDVT